MRLVFAREQHEADIRTLVQASQQAGRGPVPITALNFRTHGLMHLLELDAGGPWLHAPGDPLEC